MFKVLSLCDGIGGAAESLRSIGVKSEYVVAENDKRLNGFTSSVQKDWHSNFHNYGDMLSSEIDKLENVDLVVGGIPCQTFSIIGKRAGLNDPRGRLIFRYAEIVKKLQPRWFLLENVASMKQDCVDVFSEEVGVSPLKIDAAWYGPQRRWRYYWTNIPFEFPEEGDINESNLGDILEHNVGEEFHLKDEKLLSSYNTLKDGECWRHLPDADPAKQKIMGQIKKYLESGKKNAGGRTGFFKLFDKSSKGPTLLASGMRSPMNRFMLRDWENVLRYTTPTEWERLQGYRDGYTESLKTSVRYHALGNSFSVPTVATILKGIL